MSQLWSQSLKFLENDLNEQQFHSWIRPLKVIEEESVIRLLAPTPFILDWVNRKLMDNIRDAVKRVIPHDTPQVRLHTPPASAATPRWYADAPRGSSAADVAVAAIAKHLAPG